MGGMLDETLATCVENDERELENRVTLVEYELPWMAKM